MNSEKYLTKVQTQNNLKRNQGHRRTQSNSNYDFRQFINVSQKENDKNFKNMIETHQIFDKNQTKQALDEEAKKQNCLDEKHVVIENIEPTFQEMNRYDNADRNFFIFGKKARNMTSILGDSSEILKELDINDLSNRQKTRNSFHDSNPAKRYEREFLKEDKFFVIPEQNDLLQSTEFPSNKIGMKKEDPIKEPNENVNNNNFQKKIYADEKKEEKNSSSDSKAERFQSLMHLKSNILQAISKTNNRYNSKEEIKTSRGSNFKTLKENSTVKAKKNTKNSLTINLFKEKQKFSATSTLTFMNNSKNLDCSHQIDVRNCCKHKKNSVSVLNKKDISFSSLKKSETLKKSEKMEKDFLKLENQINFLKKKVEILENQNKNFKHQMIVISEEKNLYIKVF